MQGVQGRTSSRFTVVALALIAMLAIGASPAAAKKKKYNTEFAQVGVDRDFSAGTIFADGGNCAKGRHIVISGPQGQTEATTNSDGNFEAPAGHDTLGLGAYSATAEKKSKGKGKKKKVCKAASLDFNVTGE
jgi:hypothetical protein